MSREESSPLLPSSNREVEPSPDRATSAGQGPAHGPVEFVKQLDMVPTPRDKLALGLVYGGIVLFLPLTWYLVFSGNLKAMGWFAVHPPMQSLAITAFLLGITPLQPPPPNSVTRSSRFKSHQNLILLLALPALSIGSAAMIYNKYLHSAKHFTTWHSWFGLAVVGWTLVQAMIGASTVWWGGKVFGGEENAKRVYKYHRLSGYTLVTLSLITANLAGIYSDWAQGRGLHALRVIAFWIGLPMIWVGLTIRARPSKMKFV
ncbi:hypothetical protein CI109_103355 [Kwoniella shandongensis]|uniref:Uncharacterized protein n=1 Tax=Kwoniella shandongensis TaxID=1734106 RepID=A0A5M6BWE6_9TREE|nr:uncharacterized protein CI109_004436 [Kwoniella shandongensis]KAA5527144.1 hypothetical protein CI109_004436 [Kwoniella shandongensis]